MKIPKIQNFKINPFLNSFKSTIGTVYNSAKADSFSYCADDFNKDVLVKRGIIPENKNLSEFFDEVSAKVFKDENAKTFSSLLKGGYITLSTSCYTDLSSPYSAKGIGLKPSIYPSGACAILEDEISKGRGIGINFSKFNNPIEYIRKINSYFKYREPSLKRPPAGIALLNVNHPQILDFITLKDDEDFKNWCFDLSVVIPKDFISKVKNNENIELTNGKKLSAREIYGTLVNSMTKTGEPGIIISNDKDYLCDCCAAVPLKENEGLTLGHINLSKFYHNSKLDKELLNKSADILSKAMKNIDPNGYIGVLGYQTLLDKMGLNYGEAEANKVLEECLAIIKIETAKNGIKTAISPTGNISKFLNVSPSIEPVDNSKVSYYQEIDTLILAQKYTDGNISKTIILKPNHNIEDVDNILMYCMDKELKGISVYKKPQTP